MTANAAEMDDLDRPLWGTKAIAAEANRTERQAYHLIAKGIIPTKKVGERYVTTKRKIRTALFEGDAI